MQIDEKELDNLIACEKRRMQHYCNTTAEAVEKAFEGHLHVHNGDKLAALLDFATYGLSEGEA